MKIYREVMIESAEQAEALPEGSVAMHEDHWPFQKYQGVWQSEDHTYSNADLIGWTTYALIEAETEYSTEESERRWSFDGIYSAPENVRRDGWDGTMRERSVTEWRDLA